MAKNWTVAEATEEILSGNKGAIVDIGRRFPVATAFIAKAGENAKDILSAFNFVTVRKIESVLKDGVEIISEDEEETPKEKPVKAPKEKKAPAKKEDPKAKKATTKKAGMNKPEPADDEEEDYESMSEIELFKICKAKGLKPAPKQKKQYYLDLLNPSEDEDWDDEEEAKPAKKAPAKKSKKAAEDEDDDWNI